MMIVERTTDAAPTRLLDEALARLAPNHRYFSTYEAQAGTARTRTPVLRVTPHHDYDVCGYEATHAVYALTWAIPIICPDKPDDDRVSCLTCIDSWSTVPAPDATDELATHITWENVGEPFELRARVIPAEQRLQAAPAPDLSHLTKDQIRAYGGPDEVAKIFATRQQVTIHYDSSADIYDWDALAAKIIHIHAETQPPKLTPLQRLAMAGARRCQLEEDLTNATKSIKDLARNAHKAGETNVSLLARRAGVSRPTMYSYLPKAAADKQEQS